MTHKRTGRPPLRGVRKQSLTVRITPELRLFLDSRQTSAAEHIEEALRRTREFKEWVK